MRLLKNERILTTSIFSMCLLNVIVSIIHMAFLLPVPGFMAGITANIEVCVRNRCSMLGLKHVSCATGRHGSHGLQPPRLGGQPPPIPSKGRGYRK